MALSPPTAYRDRMLAAVLLLLPAADLDYAPAGCGNPLQGLVPYDGDWAEWAEEHAVRKKGRIAEAFPHTLEFSYFGMADLAPEPDRFDWAPLEEKLDDIASRGHQTVFRIFLEYPGRNDGLPKWLESSGVKVTRWRSPEATEAEEGVIATPDYEDERVRELLVRFIGELGERYDGDPRVGYITAGLLGMWGEWHNYPRDDLMASVATQRAVLDAYDAAFSRTPILLRYPAGEGDDQYAANVARGFGFHDDSFAWATLPTGRNADDWFFLHLLNEAGGQDVWKRQPIGGEIRPELWGKIFDAPDGQPKKAHRKAQDFVECVERSHVTWLMESGFFGNPQPSGEKAKRRYEQALARVAKMGYEFHVSQVHKDESQLEVTIRNTGVAPLYHDWRPVLRYRRASGDGPNAYTGSTELSTDWSLVGLLPGESRSFVHHLPDDAAGAVLMQIPNALPNGPPIRFANATQDADIEGWLTLPVE